MILGTNSTYGTGQRYGSDTIDPTFALIRDRPLVQHPREPGLDNLMLFIECLCAPLVDFRKVVLNTIMRIQLSNAYGIQLDRLGKLLNFPRRGLTDRRYQEVLLIVSEFIFKPGREEEHVGTIENIVKMVRAFIGPDAPPVRRITRPPYAFDIYAPNVSFEEYDVLRRLIESAIYAGVNGELAVTQSSDVYGSASSMVRHSSAVWAPNLETLVDSFSGLTGVESGTIPYDAPTVSRAIGSGESLSWDNNQDLSGALSGSVWIDASSLSSQPILMAIDDDSSNIAILLSTVSGVPQVTRFSADGTHLRRRSTGALAAGQHHLAWSYDGGMFAAGIRIFVDGVELAYSDEDDGTGTLREPSGDIHIGGDGEWTVANPAVYSRRMTPADFALIFDQGVPSRELESRPVIDSVAVYGSTEDDTLSDSEYGHVAPFGA